ncbi:MAG: FKBP-type peptidyl-prolyl cis-trans isomerase [Candidatus Bathyarchaeia archaeon]
MKVSDMSSVDDMEEAPEPKKEGEEREETVEEAQEAPRSAEVQEASEERPISRGDFILLNYTGRTEDTGEVFDTTDEEEAKRAGIYSKEMAFGPKLIILGEGELPKGLENRLEGLRVGEEREIVIPPEEAYGERNPDNVRMVPYRVLRSKGVTPTVGARVEVDGRVATVRSIGAGRVQLDYNHPLAGRRIVYKVKAVRRLEADEEKIRALIGRNFPNISTESFDIKISGGKVRIQIPEEAFYEENLQLEKRAAAVEIQRFFPKIEDVEFVEVISRKV